VEPQPAQGDTTAVVGGGKIGDRRSRSRSRGSSSSSSSSSRSRSKPAPRFYIDDRVEVFGIESESGRILNGRIGVVIQYIEESGRYEVKFGPEQIALLRGEKLRKPKDGKARFTVDDSVEVFGLTSEAGTKLNGQRGVVVCFQEATSRYEVRLGADKLTSLKPENLRILAPSEAKSAGQAQPQAEKPKAMSLAGLLGMGRPEDKKEENKPQWQSIWERCVTTSEVAIVTEEEQAALRALHGGEEKRTREFEDLRKKVEAEFAQAGIFDEGMIEEAFKQQLEQQYLQKLLRPTDEKPHGGRSSRSSSSGSSSSSRSRSRSRPRKPCGGMADGDRGEA